MIRIRHSNERGYFDHGWLRTHHTFSFADYYDPQHISFRALRVINDDWLSPGHGFPPHPHRDMEIITYVLEGALRHRDSTGKGGVIHAGEVQCMTAGTGITHSEVNASETEQVRLLQIWIYPSMRNLTPRYEQKAFTREARLGNMLLIASPDGEAGSLTIQQEARVYATILEPGMHVHADLGRGHAVWLQVASGVVDLHSAILEQGDGAAVMEESWFEMVGVETAEVLVFDLA